MAVSKSSKPTRTKATSASEWKKASSQLPLIETPTGKSIRMKRPGMTKFLEAGFLPDALATLVRKEINNVSRKKVDLEKMMSSVDGEAALEMMLSMDKIVAAVMVEPVVMVHQRERERDADGKPVMEDIPEDERRADVVYTDEIDQIDKNFIFRVASGGSTDLARFRAEHAAVMDAVPAIESLAQTPE